MRSVASPLLSELSVTVTSLLDQEQGPATSSTAALALWVLQSTVPSSTSDTNTPHAL